MITAAQLIGVLGWLAGLVILAAVVVVPVLLARWAWHAGRRDRFGR